MPADARGNRARATALGLLAGVALDQVAGDPRRGHPVALFGTAASRLEARLWRDDRAAGAAYAALLVAAPALLGLLPRRLPAGWLAAATALGTWTVLGSRSLPAEAEAVAAHLRRGDLPAAREQLTHLVGRRTDTLGEAEIARAVIESVAENTSDAVVAPLLWGAVAGLPGLLAYRAVNTLDAMVGHHSPRYENFGFASARADDVANYLPARLTAVLAAAAAPVAGGSGRGALIAARADGRRHPSPNAGVAEAAFAGALGVRLGGRNDYRSHVEDRPVLGAGGRPPRTADIARAARLSRAVTVAAALACAALAAARGRTALESDAVAARPGWRLGDCGWAGDLSERGKGCTRGHQRPGSFHAGDRRPECRECFPGRHEHHAHVEVLLDLGVPAGWPGGRHGGGEEDVGVLVRL